VTVLATYLTCFPLFILSLQIDQITIEEVDELARMPYSIVGSVVAGFNIGEPDEDDLLKQKMWEYLGLTRVYTKRKGTIRTFYHCQQYHRNHII